MQELSLGEVAFSRCFHCELTALTVQQYAKLTGQGASMELSGVPVARCHLCGGDVWGTQVKTLRALTCVGCGTLLIADAALEGALQVPGVRAAQLSFVCVGCGDSYAMAQSAPVASGLACRLCAPTLPAPPTKKPQVVDTRLGPPYELALDILDRLV